MWPAGNGPGLAHKASSEHPKVRFETVSRKPLPKIREIADKQIKLTKERLRDGIRGGMVPRGLCAL